MVFAAGGCDNAETLDPNSDAVKKAIEDYAQVSGFEAGWRAVGRKEDTRGWLDDMGELVDTVRNPLEKAAEKGMLSVVSAHTNNRINILYKAYKEKMAYQEASGNKPAITTNYDKQADLEFEAIKDFARGNGCPPDPRFESSGSNENRFFRAWIEERYSKEKEAVELLGKAKELGIPINLSNLRKQAVIPGTVYGESSHDRKISEQPYTSFNRNGQMDWNYDILRSSVARYKKFEKTFEGRLDEIFEQNGLPKEVLKLCYSQVRDTVKKDYIKKTYELMCQGKDKEAEVTEYLDREISDDMCRKVESCMSMFSDYAKKKLDCRKKNTPETKDEKKTETKPVLKDCSGLADKEKSKLFGDLCWCSCSPSTGGGAKYEGGRGCVCSGVLGGEWTVPMITSGECFKSSTASVGASEDSCRKVITDMNRQWAEKLIQMAKDLIEDFFTPLPGLSQGKKGAKKAPETQKERVERKLSGDLDKAAGYTKAAAEMYPPLESTARAVIPGTLPWRLTSLALTFVPPLEFGTSRRLLERTSRLDEKNQHVKENLSKVIQWEKEWNQIKSLSEECFSDIKAKRVCECQRLFDGKIEPLNKSFNIPTGRTVEVTFERSPDEVRWGAPKLGTRSVMEQTPIPEKDALRGKLVLELDNARRGCRYQPGLAETVGVLGAYISDRARPGRTDQAIADMAKKMLERNGLCDCERELAEKALELANKGISSSKTPVETSKPVKLDVSLMAEKSMLKTGESAYITAAVTGGKSPYKIKWSGALSGEGTTILFKAQKPGSNSVHAEVQDSLGNKGYADIVLNVGAGKTSVKETTDKDSKVNKTGKVGKSRIIELGSKPETSPSPLKLKVPQGGQTRTLVFTYQHKRVDTGKMEYVFPPPSASSYRIEPSDSGASVTRISNPAKWGKEKLFAVKINKDVKPGRKFTLTADYVGIPLPPGSTSKYMDTGEDAEEYLRKHVKSATAVIEVIAGKTTADIGNTGYDPTADPNTGGSDSKNIDIAQVDKFGDDFRNITKGSKQSDPKTDKPQAPVQQPDTYTTSVKRTDTSGEQNIYTQPPYPPVSSSDWGKDRTDWTKKWGDKGSQGYGSDTLGDSSSTKRKCDAAQKQAAYQDGVKCGQKARQNNGNMTSECITLSQGHMNRDNQLGWGSCLYSGFDEGYRAGIGTTSGDGAGAVIAELENRSGENVHIFAEGQENFSPQNRLAPGEKRKVNIKVPKAGGFVKFIAGRNGQKLAECKWEFSPGSSTRVPVVKFSDPGSLTCVTGLR